MMGIIDLGSDLDSGSDVSNGLAGRLARRDNARRLRDGQRRRRHRGRREEGQNDDDNAELVDAVDENEMIARIMRGEDADDELPRHGNRIQRRGRLEDNGVDFNEDEQRYIRHRRRQNQLLNVFAEEGDALGEDGDYGDDPGDESDGFDGSMTDESYEDSFIDDAEPDVRQEEEEDDEDSEDGSHDVLHVTSLVGSDSDSDIEAVDPDDSIM